MYVCWDFMLSYSKIFYDFVMRIFWPKDIDIIRECVARGDFEAYPFDYDPTDPNRPKSVLIPVTLFIE